MAWTDPLDLVPQVPNDWANHIVYGGALGVFILAALLALDVTHAYLFAALAVLLVAALKKTADFILEGETLVVCVGKALATAVWPASMAFFS